MLFKLFCTALLTTQFLCAKPIIYFILSDDCSICHSLMNDIKSNADLKILLSKEYQTKIIDTTKQNIPIFLPFKGTVPTIFIINENKFIGDPLEGYIPSNELMKYLTDIKNYINKRTYYAF